MSEDLNFLPHFIKEEIYIIKDNVTTEQVQETQSSPTLSSEANEPVAEYVKADPLKFKGKNLKNVVILVPEVIEEEIEFLQKILGAVKFTLDDCALVSLAENTELTQLDEISPKVILAFGINKDKYSLPATLYEISSESELKTLKADGLSSISTDNTKKKQLWEALQDLFL